MKKLAIILVFIILLVAAGYFIYQRYLGPEALESTSLTETSTGFVATDGNETAEVKDLDNPTTYDWGVAVYPGATLSSEESSSLQETSNGAQKMATAIFTTPDTVARVVAYYTDKLGPSARTNQVTVADITIQSIMPATKNSPSVGVSTRDGVTTIQIVSIK